MKELEKAQNIIKELKVIWLNNLSLHALRKRIKIPIIIRILKK